MPEWLPLVLVLIGLAGVGMLVAGARLEYRDRVNRRGLDSFDVPPPAPCSRPIDAEHPPTDFDD